MLLQFYIFINVANYRIRRTQQTVALVDSLSLLIKKSKYIIVEEKQGQNWYLLIKTKIKEKEKNVKKIAKYLLFTIKIENKNQNFINKKGEIKYSKNK